MVLLAGGAILLSGLRTCLSIGLDFGTLGAQPQHQPLRHLPGTTATLPRHPPVPPARLHHPSETPGSLGGCKTPTLPHLEGGDDLVAIVLGGDGIAHVAVRVNDGVALLPADDDGPLTPGGAVQLLGLPLDGDCGVGVGGDHGWDCREAGGHLCARGRARCHLWLPGPGTAPRPD